MSAARINRPRLCSGMCRNRAAFFWCVVPRHRRLALRCRGGAAGCSTQPAARFERNGQDERWKARGMNTPSTICANCRWFKREGPIWYDQYCGCPDVKRPAGIDPVSGATGYKGTNDLGGAYYADRPEPHARQINIDGNCPHFIRKEND